jgi:threonine dehydrogenase-like Zn-dependent dehydrogenase
VPFPPAALAEPVCVCLEGLAQARLQGGHSLLIFGDGPFGVLTAMLAAAGRMSRVVIAGHHDWRMAFAPAVGRVNLKTQPDAAAALLAANGGENYDAILLAVGRAAAVQQGLALLKPKGRLVVFSAIPEPVPVDLFQVHCRELEILGACNDQDRMDAAMAVLANPALGLGRLVTHRFPLERYAEAFDLAAHGHDQAMKVALTFGREV